MFICITYNNITRNGAQVRLFGAVVRRWLFLNVVFGALVRRFGAHMRCFGALLRRLIKPSFLQCQLVEQFHDAVPHFDTSLVHIPIRRMNVLNVATKFHTAENDPGGFTHHVLHLGSNGLNLSRSPRSQAEGPNGNFELDG
jgi:hypothetical protein